MKALRLEVEIHPRETDELDAINKLVREGWDMVRIDKSDSKTDLMTVIIVRHL